MKTGQNVAPISTYLVVRVEGRPRKSWKESVTDGLCLWNIARDMVHDRSKWKNALKAVMKYPTRGNRGKVAQSG